jgi:hypothetical protein
MVTAANHKIISYTNIMFNILKLKGFILVVSFCNNKKLLLLYSRLVRHVLYGEIEL